MTRTLPKRRLRLDFVQDDPVWAAVRGWRAPLRRALLVLMDAVGGILPPGNYAVTLLLTNDKRQKELNHQFRGQPRPTNVLSFPQFPPATLKKLKTTKGYVCLGDISLSYQYIAHESERDSKILRDHIIHLVIHGILHILGHDHMTSREAATMERLERKILAQLGLPDPYGGVPRAPCRKTR